LAKESSSSFTNQELIIDVNNLINKLGDIFKEVKRTDREMKDRRIIVSNCLEKYKKGMKNFDCLCDTLIKTIEQFEMSSNNFTTDTSIDRTEHIKEV
jgi:phage host-nuclease inhibitor protein Gam